MRPRLVLLFLIALCFSLALKLQFMMDRNESAQSSNANVLALVLGDTRKMFANHFFAKADAYFHRGNYPSIFDDQPRHEENHMAGAAHDEHDGDEDHDEHEGQDKPRDWIEGFGRHFFPSEHVHLEASNAQEMLPWLRISKVLDPHRVETYIVTAYWMRTRMNKVNEAEQLLREGLKQNPNSPNLLYELGRLLYESRKDSERARNVWLMALRRWKETEAPKKEPDQLLHEQILGGLAKIEMEAGHNQKALEYLKELKEISPVPDQVQKQIDALANKSTPQ